MKKILRVGILATAVFLGVMFLTLEDYGISWDEPIHFLRGQSYLHYFLTGKTRYDEAVEPKSHYENNSLGAEFFLVREGHPPINDVFSAVFNQVFHQKLKLLGDIEAYHLFNISAASFLVFIVVIFAYETYGLFAAVIAFLVVSLYPLFFSEAHFNVKDPAETAFFAATIWTFWKSVQKGSPKWLFLTAVFFGLALGTKFNVLFLPLIIVPYYFFIRPLKKISKRYILGLTVSPLIVLAIFFLSWPLLWQETIPNLLKVISYYKQLGTGHNYEPSFLLLGGLNLFPTYWIIVTTPVAVLMLTIIGMLGTFISKRRDGVGMLWLLWLLIPIVRVTVPGMSIYGGVRQIMEFLPAMALLAGLGASYLIQKLKLTIYKYLFILITFILLLIPIVKYHPHENVYFNFLVGGLKGAKEKNIPYWGNSYGNAYKPAIDWLNENAPINSRLALIQGTSLNIPQIMLRKDITFGNHFWSGIERKGEYLLELTHNDPVRYYPYAWDYVEKFLDPVYEVKVDGVAIAKLWKNDLEHTKPEMRRGETVYTGQLEVMLEGGSLETLAKEILTLTRLKVEYGNFDSCTSLKGIVEVSGDGEIWQKEPDPVPAVQTSVEESLGPNQMTYYFPGTEAVAVRYVGESENQCIFNDPKVTLYILK